MGVASFFETNRTGAVDNKGVRTYTRKFLIVMDAFSDAPPTTWEGMSIVRYDSMPGDSGALAVSLDCQQHGDDLGVYDLSYTYTSKPFDEGNTSNDPTQTDQSTPPPDRPWTIKIGSVHSTRLLGPRDLTDAPVVNAAGSPFDPPPEIPCSNLTLTITGFKDAIWNAGAKIFDYQDSINDSSLTIIISPSASVVFPAKTVRCTEYNATGHSENGEYFWQVDLTLEYRVKPWNPVSVLNAGLTYQKSGALPLQPILDSHGQPVTNPVPLKADGTGPLLAGGTLNYIDFKGYYEKNFAAIMS